MSIVGPCLPHSIEAHSSCLLQHAHAYLLILRDASGLQAQGTGRHKGKAAAFTREELRRLFSLEEATASETAALLRPAAAAGEWEVQPLLSNAC